MKFIVVVLAALAINLVAQIICNSFLFGSIAGAIEMLLITTIWEEW